MFVNEVTIRANIIERIKDKLPKHFHHIYHYLLHVLRRRRVFGRGDYYTREHS